MLAGDFIGAIRDVVVYHDNRLGNPPLDTLEGPSNSSVMRKIPLDSTSSWTLLRGLREPTNAGTTIATGRRKTERDREKIINMLCFDLLMMMMLQKISLTAFGLKTVCFYLKK